MPSLLLTGASSGLGAACAKHLAERGWQVYGTSRRAPPPAQAQPQKIGAGTLTLLQMDVDDEASVNAGVAWVWQQAGTVDAVVNNAGYGLAGAVEDTTVAEAQAQLATNFFGVVRVVHATLPRLRAQGRGHIVNLGSVAGVIAVPFQAYYSASKFALEGFTEALRMEVRPYGVRVALIQPGDFNTGFTAHRRRAAAAQPASPYHPAMTRALGVMEHDETHGPNPLLVAQLLERILRSPNPRLRYLVGPLYESVAVWLKQVLPPSVFEWALGKYYKL